MGIGVSDALGRLWEGSGRVSGVAVVVVLGRVVEVVVAVVSVVVVSGIVVSGTVVVVVVVLVVVVLEVV